MSRRSNYFGLWERIVAALKAGDTEYNLQHFDMKYLCNAMEDFADLEAKLKVAVETLRVTKEICDQYFPNDTAAMHALKVEIPDLCERAAKEIRGSHD